MKKSSFARFARAIIIFVHFTPVLVLSTAWNDPFCSYADDVSIWIYKFSIFSCHLQTADSNLIPGYLEYFLQALRCGIIEKFLDSILAVVT